MLVLSLAVAIGAITMLCRFRVPNPIRAVLILGLIVVLLAMVATGDLFGFRATQGEMSNLMAAEKRPGREATAPAVEQEPVLVPTPPPPTGGGAKIHLDPDVGGDKGWADRIDAALDGRIGGAGATGFAVTGTVGVATLEAEDRLTMAWSIGSDEKTVRCGVTSLVRLNPALVIDQVGASLRRAIEQSVKAGAPACF